MHDNTKTVMAFRLILDLLALELAFLFLVVSPLLEQWLETFMIAYLDKRKYIDAL